VEIRLEGKNALVTGASSGIGQGIAVALAAAGANVGINYRSNAEGAEETSRRVREAGHRALVLQADVGDPEQVTAMFRRFDAELGPIDILVANAGHGSTPKPLHETSWEEWDRVLRSNLHGAFLCGREAARRMIEAGKGGRIVNISSVHEEACNMPDDGPYCVAKGGVRNLTRAMSLELGPHGITVNDVAPGMIVTPMNRRALEDADYRAEAGALIPLRRPGTPEDIAAMVVFLCSEHASYCTGGTYLVDGGWMLSWPPV
jgi:glucose 1-dehydrogenase